MGLNLAYLLIYHNTEEARTALTRRELGMEELLYGAIKMSLEVPVTPIKKILILFLCYLRLVLGTGRKVLR